MAVRKFKPVTPGQRNKVISTFSEITAKKPQKSLLEPLKSTGGRNNTGQMTVRYVGGGHKRMDRGSLQHLCCEGGHRANAGGRPFHGSPDCDLHWTQHRL